MKSKMIIRSLLFAGITTGILTGCSKEKIGDVSLANSRTAAAVNAGKADFQNDEAGSIIGQVKPIETKARILLYDTQGRAYGPFYTNRFTGNFKIPVLVAGTYKLVIEYPGVAPDASSDQINSMVAISREVIVTGGSVTDLGEIYL